MGGLPEPHCTAQRMLSWCGLLSRENESRLKWLAGLEGCFRGQGFGTSAPTLQSLAEARGAQPPGVLHLSIRLMAAAGPFLLPPASRQPLQLGLN